MLAELRDELQEVRSLLVAGETAAAAMRLDTALQQLATHRLLTTSEAAEVLGIRSVNTLKALVRIEGIETVMHGNRMMIPLSEVERIRESARVRGIHAADRAHDAAENLGAKEGLTQEEMDALSAGRPGTPPWRHETTTNDQRHSA